MYPTHQPTILRELNAIAKRDNLVFSLEENTNTSFILHATLELANLLRAWVIDNKLSTVVVTKLKKDTYIVSCD